LTELDPVLTVLLYSSLSAGAEVLGVLPHALLGRVSLPMLGWSNALASGLMLGVAYVLLYVGLDETVLLGALGALVGLASVRLTHYGTGTDDVDLNRLDDAGPAYGYQVLLVNTLHSGYEGVAIGAAMLVSLPFGVSMAVALALHNIPEAMVLTAVLRSRDLRLDHAAALAMGVNINQVLLSVVTYSVVTALPVLLPWVIGFSVGALIYLVLVELLPESYRQAGPTSIALVALVAMGIVVALTGGGV
jgi:zinc transporter ZupT